MIILLVVILFISVTAHELFHGWIAYKLGDHTPQESGRLTLNPFSHIDLLGTIILPIVILLITRGCFTYGWAKPIPFNPYRFRNPKNDIMWVGIAGPLANLLIALALATLLKIGIFSYFNDIIIWSLTLNLVLMVFNLIPLPPLDGSKIIAAILPYRLSHRYVKMETVGLYLITILVAMGFFQWAAIPLVKKILGFLNVTAIL